MQKVATTLNVVNETDVRGQALRDLIRTYITLPTTDYGFRSIGANPGLVFPALFVEPKNQRPELEMTVKYTLRWTYGIYWYVRENTPKDAVARASFIGEALVKLLSNNALGDLNSGTPTKRFRQYPNPAGGYFWLDSEMSEIRWSTNYLNPDPQSHAARYERAGRLMFQIEDIIQK